MGKLQDCIQLVKASHSLSDEDVDAIIAATEDGASSAEAVDTVTQELSDYRGQLISQLEEAYPELTAEKKAPGKKGPKPRVISESAKKKAQSRVYNASLRDLAANGNVQQFAIANAGDTQNFILAVEDILGNYLNDRKEDARKKNDGAELSVLNEMITADNPPLVEYFNSEYYKNLQSKARRASENAEKERKKSAFKEVTRDALRSRQWGEMTPEQIRSYVRGWRHALARKSKSNLKDQSEYANTGFKEAKDLMAKHNMTAGKQAKFIGTGGRLRRMHEMIDSKADGEKTDKQFMEGIYRATSRTDLLSHDLIHPLAPGGVHRALDVIRDNMDTFKIYIGREHGGGRRSWHDSFSQAALNYLAGDPEKNAERRKEIEEAAGKYLDAVAPVAEIFEKNGQNDLFALLNSLRDFAYEDSEKARVLSSDYKKLREYGYNGFLRGTASYLLTGDDSSRNVTSMIERQNDPYVPPTRTKPLIRKKLDSIVRTGFPTHRDGTNVTASQMQKDLGFKEVFAGINGNVQEHMNYGYDAYMDLAQLIEMPSEKIGLSRLWFGVGALGQGGKTAAHFSPGWPLPSNEGDIPEGYNAGDKIPHIHLTATSGDGSVAHEWTHALDWALEGEKERALVGAMYQALKKPYTTRESIERDMAQVYNRGYLWATDPHPDALAKYPGKDKASQHAQAGYSFLLYMRQADKAPYRFQRNYDMQMASDFFQDALRLDEGASKTYWSTSKELLARAAEAYFYDSIVSEDKQSDYLVSSWVADGTLNKSTGYKGRPYPEGDERKRLNMIYESFLRSVDFTGETPKASAEFDPETGLLDKQNFLTDVDKLISEFDEYHAGKRKEIEEEDARVKSAEEKAAQDQRDAEIGGLEELVEDLVEEEEQPLFEDMSDDSIADLVDEVEADIKAAEQEDHTEDLVDESNEETIASLMKDAGEHGTEALKGALQGLSALFGTNGKLNTFPPGFDPEGYAKAKPLFITAFGELKLAIADVKKIIAKLLQAFPSMKPYLTYFLQTDYKQMQLHKRSFAEYLYQQIKADSAPTNNAQLKRMLSLQKGKPVDEISQLEMKDAQEAIEVAVVRYARDIVAGKGTQDQKFNSLLDLYQKQPLLNITTTTSSDQQAYSTPVPLAYLVSLAAEANKGRVFEPTAGNGSLLINTQPENAIANELNEERANNLRGQGFTVDGKDALDYVESGYIKTKVDAIITNPPFGALHEEGRAHALDRTGYKIEKIDQAIVAESLRALKNDGKASIIIGASKEAGEISNQDRVFFNWLYSNYNVKDHFEIDGALYRRQGAGWPIRVIQIDGRKSQEDEAVSPISGDIKRLNNWSEVYERFTGKPITAGLAPEIGQPTAGTGAGGGGPAATGLPADDTGAAPGTVAGEAGTAGEAELVDGAGDDAGAGAGLGQGGRGGAGRAGGDATTPGAGVGTGGPATEGEPGAAGTGAGSELPGRDKRAGKRLDEFQSQYTTFSEGETDPELRVPANQAQAITDSLNKLVSEVGNIDEYLVGRLEYKDKEAKAFVEGRAAQDNLEMVGGKVKGGMSFSELNAVVKGLNLPKEVADKVTVKALKPGRKSTMGNYNVVTGEVELYAARIPDVDTALRVLRHEIFAHWGLRELLTPEELNDLLARVYNSVNHSDQLSSIYGRVRAAYPGASKTVIAEEMVAKLAEDGVEIGVTQQIWNFIKHLLRKMGLLRAGITVAEIHQLINKSRRNLERGGQRRRITYPQVATEFESRYDTPEQEAMAAKVGNLYDERTLTQKLKDKWNNEIQPHLWKKVEQSLFDRYASLRNLDLHTWKLARMSHTASGVVEHLFKYGRVKIDEDGGIQTGSEGELGQSLGEILAPLGDEVDRFFNWMIANRAQGLAEEGREKWLTDEDIEAGLSMIEGETESGDLRQELYTQAQRQFIDLHEHVLDIAEELGVINSDDRATWKNEFYIPFYRVLDGDTEATGPKMLDGLTGQTAYKRLKGAQRQIGDPMSNILSNWHNLIDSGLKNQAAQHAVRKGMEMGIIEETDKRTKGAFFVRQEEEVENEAGEMKLKKGVKTWYKSNDDLVLDAISALNLNDINFPGMKTLNTFKRVFTAGVTMSPGFMVANLIRDSIHSAAVTPTTKNPLMNVIRGIDYTKKGSEWERRMLAGGGALHFGLMYADDPAGAKLLIKKHIQEDSIITEEEGRNKYHQMTNGLINRWMEAGSRIENINRTALYAKLIEEGVSEFEANFQARDLLDFSQGGAHVLVRFLTQSVPFLNARLQGLHKVGRAWGDPKQRAQFISVLGAYLAASMALYLMYKDDDDFKKREEWDRDSYHWFKVGDTAFRIPRPFEIGVGATVAERLWEVSMEDESSAELFGERMLHALGQTFEFDPMPHMFRPLWNIGADKDPFTKRRIEGESLRGLPPEERRRLWTSETAIGLSKAMGTVLWEDATLSPVQIEYLIKGYLGWVGATMLSTTDMAARGILNEPSRPAPRLPADLPLFGRFMRDLPEPHTKYMSRFYEQNDRIKKIYNMIQQRKKMGDKAGYKAAIKEHKEELKFKRAYGKVQRALSKVNAEIMRIRMSNIDRDEKKRRIDALTQKKNDLAEKIVRRHGY